MARTTPAERGFHRSFPGRDVVGEGAGLDVVADQLDLIPVGLHDGLTIDLAGAECRRGEELHVIDPQARKGGAEAGEIADVQAAVDLQIGREHVHDVGDLQRIREGVG